MALPSYSLSEPLPPAMLVRHQLPWRLYTHYPVFSWPWLRGRSKLFLAVIAAMAVLAGLGAYHESRDTGTALAMAALQFGCFGLMATIAPALASWVRHRGWADRREKAAILLSQLLGVAACAVVDFTASAQLEQLKGIGASKPDVVPSGWLLGANVVGLLLVYAIFGGGLALRAYFTERRRWQDHQQQEQLAQAELRAQQADLRLGVLQAQVEPHFLFNTLASVRATVHDDPAHAAATLDALVAFLRSTIPRLRADGAELDSTLRQQLEICSHYLEVMQLRTGGRLRHRVEVDAGLLELAFPPSVLITLVENAVKHGIEPRTGPGLITINARRDAGRLRVAVSDDGVGLQPGLGGGMGLANVREHLQHRYGDRARLALESRPEGGVTATLELPA